MIGSQRSHGPQGAARPSAVAGRLAAGSCVVATVLGCPAVAAGADGAYGRLDGDLGLAVAVGVSEAFPGESLAARGGALYLQSAGIFVQYDDGLGMAAQPMARSLVAGLEVRPLFLGRFASDLEQGPAVLDLWLDSWSLGLGVLHVWGGDDCGAAPDDPAPERVCGGFGMEGSTGFELPLLPRHDGPFVGLRLALRWPGDTGSAAVEAPGPTTLVTLTLGYRHLLDVHLVDAADRLPP